MKQTNWVDVVGVVLIAVCGGFAALLEALLVPLYIGSVIAPIAVLLAIMTTAGLPRLADALISTAPARLAPFVTWLLVMIVFGVLTRPEGDVILPGAPRAAEYVTYGVLLGGALVGTVTIVWLSPPPASKKRAPLNR